MSIVSAHARLAILRELTLQSGYSLNEILLQYVLEAVGISRSREWLREELRALADLGAITVSRPGAVQIAVLTEKGRDHVEGRIVLEGVRRPEPG